MIKMVQEFIQFCFRHGNFLRNRKEFSEMSQRLLEAALNHELGVRETALAKTITSRIYAPEILVAVPPEGNFSISQEFDPDEVIPVFVLVYRFERRVSEKEYAYVFGGGRLHGR